MGRLRSRLQTLYCLYNLLLLDHSFNPFPPLLPSLLGFITSCCEGHSSTFESVMFLQQRTLDVTGLAFRDVSRLPCPSDAIESKPEFRPIWSDSIEAITH